MKQDHAEAVQWYGKAADQGVAVAQFNLGLAYDDGQGVPQNLLAAYAWFTIAAANGYTKAEKGMANTKKKINTGPTRPSRGTGPGYDKKEPEVD